MVTEPCIVCTEAEPTRPFPNSIDDQHTRPGNTLCAECWLVVAERKLDDASREMTNQLTQASRTSLIHADIDGAVTTMRKLEEFAKSVEAAFKQLSKDYPDKAKEFERRVERKLREEMAQAS